MRQVTRCVHGSRCGETARRVTCPAQAEQCPECQACYVRSCASFECIPAVEVFLEDGITDEEVNTRDSCHMTASAGCTGRTQSYLPAKNILLSQS